MRASTLLLAATPVFGFAERAEASPLGCAVGCIEKAIDVAKDYCLCKKDNSQNENDASAPCVVQACFPAEAARRILQTSVKLFKQISEQFDDRDVEPPIDITLTPLWINVPPSGDFTTTIHSVHPRAATPAETDISVDTTSTATPTEPVAGVEA